MDRELISAIAHLDHPVAAPVSDTAVERLLRRAKLPDGARLLDLGCGPGEWALRALELVPSATADGVDLSPHAVSAAGRAAAARGLSGRFTAHLGDATAFPAAEPYDLVLAVGSTHAFGGLKGTLRAAARHLRPGGLALVGEGFWERPPGPELEAAIGGYPDLAGTVDSAEAGGWLTVHAHVSDRAEWDDYEFSWTGGLARWAAEHPGPDAEHVLRVMREHRELWLTGYRDVLGFVTLLLLRRP
ncbi:class I SAM-dependent methyltransferase [Actinomadura sp. ATCC 31491]|uniref:Class I SAM-dependent methyltransferase n=1 Tax=Actinomadura luzonensis TaxID=2805427 RepID=A0ABT0GAC3_9ACTN|nr:class I SAM-dependent methyltransferase [Actinomadura luzonensis]MCK2221557.1 class I SAM-dependent methyltransferase [Actinomadura luzonensis]